MNKAIHASAGAVALALTLLAPMNASAADALRVVRDPVTGEMRGPTAAEAAAFAKAEAQLRLGGKAPSKTPKAPTEIQYPDGTVETKLDEDTMMFSVVSANADGTLSFDCLPADQAKQFMKQGKATAASKSKTQAQAAKAKHNHEH